MRLIGKRNRNAVCTVRICGSIRNQGLAKKQLLSENKMWRGNSFVGQTPLFTPLYIFLPVSFLSPYKILLFVLFSLESTSSPSIHLLFTPYVLD